MLYCCRPGDPPGPGGGRGVGQLEGAAQAEQAVLHTATPVLPPRHAFRVTAIHTAVQLLIASRSIHHSAAGNWERELSKLNTISNILNQLFKYTFEG